MADTLYVNKPGSVIVQLTDGTSEQLLYGQKVPDNVADHVNVSRFADSTPRRNPLLDELEAEAHRRAAFAEDGQVNSSSSVVPGNYSELDEDGAAILMGNLAKYPEKQAALLLHEILYGGNRTKVADAAGDYAKTSAKAQLGAIPEELRTPSQVDEHVPVPSGLGDPGVQSAEQINETALAQQGGTAAEPVGTVKKSAKRVGRAVPAPSSEVAANVTSE